MQAKIEVLETLKRNLTKLHNIRHEALKILLEVDNLVSGEKIKSIDIKITKLMNQMND